MVRIALTKAQLESIAEADQPVEVVDVDGRFIGFLTCGRPEPAAPLFMSAEGVEKLIDRVKEPVDDLLTTSQAIERIRNRVNR